MLKKQAAAAKTAGQFLTAFPRNFLQKHRTSLYAFNESRPDPKNRIRISWKLNRDGKKPGGDGWQEGIP